MTASFACYELVDAFALEAGERAPCSWELDGDVDDEFLQVRRRRPEVG